MINQLIESERDEIDKHDFDNRAQTCRSGTNGQSHDRAFADRRVDHALGSVVFRQSFGDTKGSAE